MNWQVSEEEIVDRPGCGWIVIPDEAPGDSQTCQGITVRAELSMISNCECKS